MPEIVNPKDRIPAPDGNYRIIVWKLKAGQEGAPESDVAHYKKTMVQVVGELAGAQVEIRGSILPKEFDLLSDFDSIPLSFQYRGMKSTEDRFMEIKAVISGGDARTEVTVAVLMCR